MVYLVDEADMALSPKGWTALLLTMSGIFSAFVSFFGAFGLLWTGGSRSGITALLFFGFPVLSFPVFYIYFLSNEVGKVCSLFILIATYIFEEITMMTSSGHITYHIAVTFIGKALLAPFEYPSQVWAQLIATSFLFWASQISTIPDADTLKTQH